MPTERCRHCMIPGNRDPFCDDGIQSIGSRQLCDDDGGVGGADTGGR